MDCKYKKVSEKTCWRILIVRDTSYMKDCEECGHRYLQQDTLRRYYTVMGDVLEFDHEETAQLYFITLPKLADKNERYQLEKREEGSWIKINNKKEA